MVEGKLQSALPLKRDPPHAPNLHTFDCGVPDAAYTAGMKRLLFPAIAVCLAILPSRAEEAKQEPPKSLKTYVIPAESFHCINDIEETTRRWNATKEMMTLDVFSIHGEKPPKVLTPIVKGAALKKMETKEQEKTFHVEILATEDQDRRIREALEKKAPLQAGYYHYGW